MTHPWGSFHPNFEMLPLSQRTLWPALKAASGLGFVLYGGTAIALRLGHRESVDFDFFSSRPFSHEAILNAIPALSDAMVIQEEPNTLSVSLDPVDSSQNSLKVSFFTVGAGRVGIPEWTSDGVALVASMSDLMSFKLKVLVQRVEKKDYLDIHAMIESGISLQDGLSCAKAMFGKAFQPSEALKTLIYFKGGDLSGLSAGVKKSLIQAVNAVQEIPPVPRVHASLHSGDE